MNATQTDDLRVIAGRSIQQWAMELSRRLSVDDCWRLMMAGTITVLQAEHGPAEIAEVLRELANLIEQGALAPEKVN